MASKGTENPLLSIEDALDAPVNELKNIYADHVNPGFVKMLSLLGLDKKFVRASLSSFYDRVSLTKLKIKPTCVGFIIDGVNRLL